MSGTPDLQVLATVKRAFNRLIGNPGGFLELAGMPVLASAFLSVIFGSILSPDGQSGQGGTQEDLSILHILTLVGLFVTFVLSVMFMVAWYRRCILTGPAETAWQAFRWNSIRSRFLVRMIAIGGIMILALALSFSLLFSLFQSAGLPPAAAFVASVLLALALNGRLVLVLPATAVGEVLSLKESWRLSSGFTNQMVLIQIIPILPVLVLMLLVTLFIGVDAMENLMTGQLRITSTLTGNFLLALGRELLAFAWYAVQVGAIADAYTQLKSRRI